MISCFKEKEPLSIIFKEEAGPDFLPLVDESTEASQIPGLDSTIPWSESDLAFLDDTTSPSPLDMTDASASNFLIAAAEPKCSGTYQFVFCCADFTHCRETKQCTNDEVLNCYTLEPGKTPDQFHDCEVYGAPIRTEVDLNTYLATPAGVSDFNFDVDSVKSRYEQGDPRENLSQGGVD